jgi:hypothetical protein
VVPHFHITTFKEIVSKKNHLDSGKQIINLKRLLAVRLRVGGCVKENDRISASVYV